MVKMWVTWIKTEALFIVDIRMVEKIPLLKCQESDIELKKAA